MIAKSRWLCLILYLSVSSVLVRGGIQDSGGPLIPEQAAYDVTFYELNLKIDPESQSISGWVMVEAIVLDKLSVFVLDLNTNFTVDSVLWKEDDQGTMALSFDHRQEGSQTWVSKLWIELPNTVRAGEKLIIQVYYRGESLFYWRKTQDNQDWVGVSCEAEGGDQWWPCKDHPSDEPDSVALHFTVPQPLTCVSNGRLRNITENDDHTRTFQWFVSNPINNYNVTFYLAPYRTIEYSYQSVTGEIIPVTFWILPESYEVAVSHTPQFLDHLSFLEETCGPYPFRADKYGVAETPYLGMEHQTIIAYGFGYKNGSCGFDWLHLHELSHEWWGNMVTAEDWSDAWIHEGFATYMEALYAEHLGGIDEYRGYLEDKILWANTTPIAPRESITMNQAWETGDIYFKAAWVIHTLRYYLGDGLFFTLLRRWVYPEPAMEAVTNGDQCRLATTDDFLRQAEEVTGMELGWFFEAYLRQASLPTLNAVFEDDTLSLTWDVENDVPFNLPVEVKIGDSIIRVDMSRDIGKVEVPQGVCPTIDPNHWVLMNPVSIEGVGGWVTQNSGTLNHLYSIHFPEANVGCVVGLFGTIVQTTDGGENWNSQTSGTSGHLLSIHFADSNSGWAVGGNGIVLKTTDGGTHWIEQNSGMINWLYSTYFINANTGCAVGHYGAIIKTTDGGVNWHPQTSGTSNTLRSVYFTDTNTGWVVGDNGTILKTDDGGASWSTQNSGTSDRLRSVYFTDADTGWVVGDNGAILKTTNGGNDWTPVAEVTSKDLRSVHFTNVSTGWVVGDNGTILHSTDGGTTWASQTSGTLFDLKSVYFPDTDRGWVVGTNGTILMRTVSGETSVITPSRSCVDVPNQLVLLQNYPNPFNRSTTIRYRLASSSHVSLKVYNLLGRAMATLVEEYRSAGEYSVLWKADGLPSGIYFCRLEIGDSFDELGARLGKGTIKTRKLILQK